MTREERIRQHVEGVSALAEFLLAHPELPLPMDVLSVTYDIFAPDRETASRWARVFGTFEKTSFSSWFICTKKFGPVNFDLNAERSLVCRRKVVGTREVPERVEPARTEEIVEWECDEPILAEVQR